MYTHLYLILFIFSFVPFLFLSDFEGGGGGGEEGRIFSPHTCKVNTLFLCNNNWIKLVCKFIFMYLLRVQPDFFTFFIFWEGPTPPLKGEQQSEF